MASATKRGNSYILRTSLGYNSKGEQVQKFRTWKPEPEMTEKQLQKELDRQLILFEEQCRTGRTLDGSMKFEAFAEYWLDEYAKKQLRSTTLKGYTDMLKRIYPAIGHIRIDRIQPNQLMEFYSNLQEKGIRGNKKYSFNSDFKMYLKSLGMTQIVLSNKAETSIQVVESLVRGDNITEESAMKISKVFEVPLGKVFKPVKSNDKPLAPKTVLHYHRLISSILEKAVKWQAIYANPCDRVEAPKIERKEARYLDEKQAALLLDLLNKEPLQYKVMITLLLYSGMRRGELCGLEWTDIDFENNIADINKSLLYVNGKGVFEDTTKNFSSKRVIKIPVTVIELLREHKAAQGVERFRLGDKWEESGKLFTQWNGRPIHPDTITSWFHDFIKRCDLPDISIHSLRHTNATLLIANGVDLRTVSKRLGHAQLSTTGNIYTHAIQSADERAADVLGDILTPLKADKKKA